MAGGTDGRPRAGLHTGSDRVASTGRSHGLNAGSSDHPRPGITGHQGNGSGRFGSHRVAGARQHFAGGHAWHDGHGGWFGAHRDFHHACWGFNCWHFGGFPCWCAGWCTPFFGGWGWFGFPPVFIYVGGDGGYDGGDGDDSSDGDHDSNYQAAPAPPGIDPAIYQRFQRAREAFLEGDYGKAQYRIEESIRSWPDDPVLREFRALVLFARRNYAEAAPELATVLASGPGWDWQTLRSFYPNTEAYDEQLRRLEDFVRENPGSEPGHFVLAYQYLCLDERDAAHAQLEEVLRLRPDDSIATRLMKMLEAAGPAQPGQEHAPDAPSPR